MLYRQDRDETDTFQKRLEIEMFKTKTTFLRSSKSVQLHRTPAEKRARSQADVDLIQKQMMLTTRMMKITRVTSTAAALSLRSLS